MAKKNNKNKGVFSIVRDFFRRTVIFFKGHNVQFVIGLLFAAFAIFLCSSFISFFSKGGADYSVLEATAGAVADAPV